MVSEYGGSGDPKRTIELLWGVPERPRRGPKPRLSVDQIAQQAIEIADRDGLAGLSMRRVAEELGVTAMTLYGYVPSKAELLDVMADRVYGELAPPDRVEAGWRARLDQLARQNRALYLAHPWLLQVASIRPLLGPNMTAKYDHELRAVDGLGLTEIEMDLLVSLVGDYVNGAVRPAVEAAQAQARTGMSDQQWWEAYGPLLGEVLDPERFPTAMRVGAAAGAAYDAAHDPDRSFEFGLQRILDGIEAFIQQRSPDRGGPS